MEDTASRSGEEEAGDEQDDAGHVGPSNLSRASRAIRNMAEKQRRDKYNHLLQELAKLVPYVASSPKKMDKASILRLTTAFLRSYQVVKESLEEKSVRDLTLEFTSMTKWMDNIFEIMGPFLIVTCAGKIVFISKQIEDLLGYHINDLLGESMYNITCPEDQKKLTRNLQVDVDPSELPSTSTEEDDGTNVRKFRRSFFLRLKRRALSKSDQIHYEQVHVEGHLCMLYGDSKNDKNVLRAVIRPCRDKRISSYSILEASNDLWVSRHLLDGTVVESDHRVSVVSGYLCNEVRGTKAFQYMHKEDALWVLIALRQMYYRRENFGSSCYRLLSKNGEYIFIKTRGYLQINDDVPSFICVNSLISAQEGPQEILDMIARLKPFVEHTNEPGTSALASTSSSITVGTASPEMGTIIRPLNVEDPNELKTAIDNLLTEVPANNIPVTPDPPVLDQQFAKIALESKNLPPVTEQTLIEVGVKTAPRLKQIAIYDRPSVITSLPRSNDIMETFIHKSKRTVNNEEKVSVLKRKRHEETSVIRTEQSVIRVAPREESGHSQHYNIPFIGHHVSSPQHLNNSYNMSTESFFDPTIPGNFDDPIEIRSHHVELEVPANGYVAGLLETDDGLLEEGVFRGHLHLENNMENQKRQIIDIENDLTSVPLSNAGTNHIHKEITQIRDEHRKQQQMLKTYQQERQHIINCNDKNDNLG